MLNVNHANEDSVLCYNDVLYSILLFLTTREFIAIGNILFISLSINILVLCETILHKGNNLSFKKIGAV